MRLSSFTIAVFLAGTGMAMAAPISVGVPAGNPPLGSPPTTPSFTWQGFVFELDGQPSGGTSAAHRVAGDSTGELSFFLEEPGKVTYKTTGLATSAPRQDIRIGTRYGEDLSAPTSAFSYVQPFLRTLQPDPDKSIAVSLLSGSDANNPDSPFTGIQARDADRGAGGFGSNAFIPEVAFGGESLYQ